MGVGASTPAVFLPASSAAIILYLGHQRFEREAPWKREQLAKEVRDDPDILALNCWAIACEQQPGCIPNPGGVRTPQQFVVAFREAVTAPPAKAALAKWYAAMRLPLPDVYDQPEAAAPEAADGWGPWLSEWVCARSVCGPRDPPPRPTVEQK